MVGFMVLQALVEGLLKEYTDILILRVRMPIVADLLYPRNFITKILKYEKVRGLLFLCLLVSSLITMGRLSPVKDH